MNSQHTIWESLHRFLPDCRHHCLACNAVYGSEKITLAGAIIFSAAILLVLFLFFKSAYEITWWQAIICLILLACAYIYILKLYGMICFLIFI